MLITKQWLKEKSACKTGVDWFTAQKESSGIKVVKKLVKEKKLDWANWLIVRIMDYKQRVQYAVFAAEQVIHIYEKKYPDDKRPRKAIEAAKKCINNPSEENKNAAYAAADAAYAAAYAAADAAYAANAANAANAADAAYAAADAAYAANAANAADAAYAAVYAAADAADAANAANAADAADAAYAAYAAYAAKDNLKKKILEYGLKLLEKN